MKVRRISVNVDAEQFFPDVKPWPRGVRWIERYRDQDGSWMGGFHCTQDGNLLEAGSWIVQGEMYPLSEERFARMYEPSVRSLVDDTEEQQT